MRECSRVWSPPGDRVPRVAADRREGALIGLDPANPLASVVVFQYNPDEMTRTLQARAATGGEGATAGGPATRRCG